jgi:hypothetical protein
MNELEIKKQTTDVFQDQNEYLEFQKLESSHSTKEIQQIFSSNQTILAQFIKIIFESNQPYRLFQEFPRIYRIAAKMSLKMKYNSISLDNKIKYINRNLFPTSLEIPTKDNGATRNLIKLLNEIVTNHDRHGENLYLLPFVLKQMNYDIFIFSADSDDQQKIIHELLINALFRSTDSKLMTSLILFAMNHVASTSSRERDYTFNKRLFFPTFQIAINEAYRSNNFEALQKLVNIQCGLQFGRSKSFSEEHLNHNFSGFPFEPLEKILPIDKEKDCFYFFKQLINYKNNNKLNEKAIKTIFQTYKIITHRISDENQTPISSQLAQVIFSIESAVEIISKLETCAIIYQALPNFMVELIGHLSHFRIEKNQWIGLFYVLKESIDKLAISKLLRLAIMNSNHELLQVLLELKGNENPNEKVMYNILRKAPDPMVLDLFHDTGDLTEEQIKQLIDMPDISIAAIDWLIEYARKPEQRAVIGKLYDKIKLHSPYLLNRLIKAGIPIAPNQMVNMVLYINTYGQFGLHTQLATQNQITDKFPIIFNDLSFIGSDNKNVISLIKLFGTPSFDYLKMIINSFLIENGNIALVAFLFSLQESSIATQLQINQIKNRLGDSNKQKRFQKYVEQIIRARNKNNGPEEMLLGTTTIKMVANIIGDKYINNQEYFSDNNKKQKTPLEGALESETDFYLGNLCRAIGRNEAVEAGFSPHATEQLELIAEQFEESGILASKIEEAMRNNPIKERACALKQLTKEIALKIKRLEKGKSIVLPLGYPNQSPTKAGHSLLLEIRYHEKDQQTGYQVSLYNTGAGTSWHEQLHNGQKPYVSTVRRYRIPTMLMHDERFIMSLLESKLITQDPGAQIYQYGANAIYIQLEPFSDNSKENDEDEDLAKWHTKQESGTCAARVRMAYIAHKLGIWNYRQFKRIAFGKIIGYLIDLYGNDIVKQRSLHKLITHVGINVLAQQVKVITQMKKNATPVTPNGLISSMRQLMRKLQAPYLWEPAESTQSRPFTPNQLHIKVKKSDKTNQDSDIVKSKAIVIETDWSDYSTIDLLNIQNKKDFLRLLQEQKNKNIPESNGMAIRFGLLSNLLKELAYVLLETSDQPSWVEEFQNDPQACLELIKWIDSELNTSLQNIPKTDTINPYITFNFALCIIWQCAKWHDSSNKESPIPDHQNINFIEIDTGDFENRIHAMDRYGDQSPTTIQRAKEIDFLIAQMRRLNQGQGKRENKKILFKFDRKDILNHYETTLHFTDQGYAYAYANRFVSNLTPDQTQEILNQIPQKFRGNLDLENNWIRASMYISRIGLPPYFEYLEKIFVQARISEHLSFFSPILTRFSVGPLRISVTNTDLTGELEKITYNILPYGSEIWPLIPPLNPELIKENLSFQDAIIDNLQSYPSQNHIRLYGAQFYRLTHLAAEKRSGLQFSMLIDYLCNHSHEIKPIELSLYLIGLQMDWRGLSNLSIDLKQELDECIEKLIQSQQLKIRLNFNVSNGHEFLIFLHNLRFRIHAWSNDGEDKKAIEKSRIMIRNQIKENNIANRQSIDLYLLIISSYRNRKKLRLKELAELFYCHLRVKMSESEVVALHNQPDELLNEGCEIIARQYNRLRKQFSKEHEIKKFIIYFLDSCSIAQMEIKNPRADHFPILAWESNGNQFSINLFTGLFQSPHTIESLNYLITEKIKKLHSPELDITSLKFDPNTGFWVGEDKISPFRFNQKNQKFERNFLEAWYERIFTTSDNDYFSPGSHCWKCKNQSEFYKIYTLPFSNKIDHTVSEIKIYTFQNGQKRLYQHQSILEAQQSNAIKNFDKLDPEIQLWSSPDENYHEIHYPKFIDEDGIRMIFEWREIDIGNDRKEHRWVWRSNPHLFISEDQTLTGIRSLAHYLVLENGIGTKELLIAPGIYYRKTKGTLTVERISLKKNHPHTNETKKNLLLTILALHGAANPEDYLQASRYLVAGFKFEKYTVEELKILEEIILFNPVKNKEIQEEITPDLIAIKLYAVWLQRDNELRNPENKNENESLFDFSTHKKLKFRAKHEKQLIKKYQSIRNRVQYELKLEILIHASNLSEWQKTWKDLRTDIHRVRYFPQREVRKFTNHELNILNNPLTKFDHDRNSLSYIFPVQTGIGLIERFWSLYDLAQSANQSVQNEVKQIIRFSQYENSALVKILEAILYYKQNLSNTILIIKARKIFNFIEQFKVEWMKDQNQKIDRVKLNQILTDFNEHQIANDPMRNFGIDASQYIFSTYPYYSRWTDRISKIDLSLKNLPPTRKRTMVKFDVDPTNRYDLTELLKGYFEIVPKEAEEERVQWNRFKPFEFPTNDLTTRLRIAQLNDDYRAGIKKNSAILTYRWKTPANKEGSNSTKKQLDELMNHLTSRLESAKLNAKQIKHQAIEIAKKFQYTKSNEAKQEQWKFTVLQFARQAKRIGMNELIHFFSKWSLEDYQQYCNLTDDDTNQIREVHSLVGNYLLLKVQINQLRIVIHLAQRYEKEQKTALFQTLCQELHRVHKTDFNRYPTAVLVLEASEKIIQKPDQLAALEDLEVIKKNSDSSYTYQNVFKQMIQGAGKSLILGPEEMVIHADGYHLAVYVPASAQYRTILNEMPYRSERMFGQKGRTIQFDDRPEHMTTEYLNCIISTMIHAIHDREYIIVTKESLLAIRGKYIKLKQIEIEKSKKKNDEPDKSLAKLEIVLAILKTRAIFTFDEMHQAFTPRVEVNLPTGISINPNRDHARLIGDILKYAILAKDKEGNSLLNLRQNRQAELLEQSKDPLIDQIRVGIESDPKWQKMEDIELQILLKNMLEKNWLFEGLAQRVNEHHGITQMDNKIPISVPYVANMKEAEGSEFSDPIVMILNTLLCYHSAGLDLKLIKNLIQKHKKKLIEEINLLVHVGTMDLTENLESREEFYRATNLDLILMDPEKEEDLIKVQKALLTENSFAIDLVNQYVIDHIIPQVNLYPTQVSSNGQNLASMALAFNAFSGTLDNLNLAPVGTNIIPDFGTNGQTIDLLIRQNDQIWLTTDSIDAFFHEIIQRHPNGERIQTLIDVGCQFVGVPNQEIAKLIAENIRQPGNKLKHIQGVLFYNKKDQLAFIKVNNPNHIHILLKSDLDSIQIETGIKLRNLFIYFGNGNIEGFNLPLEEESIGIVTLGKQNPKHHLIQGCKRMRKLDDQQRIIFAIQPSIIESMAKEIKKPEIKTVKQGRIDPRILSIQDLILLFELNTEKEIKPDNLTLAIQKTENIAQQSVLDSLIQYNLSNSEEKDQNDRNFSDFKSLFEREILIKLADQYENGTKKISTKKYLETIQNYLYTEVLRILKSPLITETVKQSMNTIITTALQEIEETIDVPHHFGNSTNKLIGLPKRNASHRQFNHNIQKVNQQTKVKQTQIGIRNNRKIDPALLKDSNIAKHQKLKVEVLTTKKFYEPLSIKDYKCNTNSPSIFSLNDAINNLIQLDLVRNDTNQVIKPLFSPEILFTSNFGITFKDRFDLFPNIRKPVLQLLLVKEKNKHKVTNQLIICSLDDAIDIKTAMESIYRFEDDRELYLIRANGKVIDSTASIWETADFSQNREVLRILTQVHFYAGNLSELSKKPFLADFKAWIEESGMNREYKWFFENHVLTEEMHYSGTEIERILNR